MYYGPSGVLGRHFTRQVVVALVVVVVLMLLLLLFLQIIVRHPCHLSHLCQDLDSITRTFLIQFVLVSFVITAG